MICIPEKICYIICGTTKQRSLKMNRFEMIETVKQIHKDLDGNYLDVLQYLEDMAVYRNDRRYIEMEAIYEEMIENGEIIA